MIMIGTSNPKRMLGWYNFHLCHSNDVHQRHRVGCKFMHTPTSVLYDPPTSVIQLAHKRAITYYHNIINFLEINEFLQ